MGVVPQEPVLFNDSIAYNIGYGAGTSDLEEVIAAEPDLILLPSEPFAFGENEKKEISNYLAFTPAVKNNRVVYVDGSLLTWHGVRLGKALQDLPEIFI